MKRALRYLSSTRISATEFGSHQSFPPAQDIAGKIVDVLKIHAYVGFEDAPQTEPGHVSIEARLDPPTIEATVHRMPFVTRSPKGNVRVSMGQTRERISVEAALSMMDVETRCWTMDLLSPFVQAVETANEQLSTSLQTE